MEESKDCYVDVDIDVDVLFLRRRKRRRKRRKISWPQITHFPHPSLKRKYTPGIKFTSLESLFESFRLSVLKGDLLLLTTKSDIIGLFL